MRQGPITFEEYWRSSRTPGLPFATIEDREWFKRGWEAAVHNCCAAICEHCREGRAVFDKGWALVHEYYDEETGLMLYNVECKANSIRRL